VIIFQKITDLKKYLLPLKNQEKTIGFVPTMGALHEGHINIVRKSKAENDVTVASVFVNPTQFNNREDFDKYPISIDADIEMLEKNHCDVLFMPSEKEMYPEGQAFTLDFNPGFLDTVMEGAHRPGHFKGVAQVVKRLLDIVEPDVLYLGQKDFQQYKVIEKMIGDLHLPVQLRMAPTVREADGLAMSSRNRRLTNAALQLSSISTEIIKQESLEELKEIPGCEPEYFEIADAGSLQLLTNIEEKKTVVICTAAWLDGVRLIDNVVVKV
jgi:pantoate--beta-alanine ligase